MKMLLMFKVVTKIVANGNGIKSLFPSFCSLQKPFEMFSCFHFIFIFCSNLQFSRCSFSFFLFILAMRRINYRNITISFHRGESLNIFSSSVSLFQLDMFVSVQVLQPSYFCIRLPSDVLVISILFFFETFYELRIAYALQSSIQLNIHSIWLCFVLFFVNFLF